MHNATTKQRLSALRRKLGIFTGASGRAGGRNPLVHLRRAATEALRPFAAYAFPTEPLAIAAAPAGAAPHAGGPVALEGAPARLEETAAAGPQEIRIRASSRASAPADPAARARARLVTWLTIAAFLAAAGVVAEFSHSRARSAPERAAAAALPAQQPAVAIPTAGAGPAAAPAPTGVRVEVRSGDTLWHLAATHLGDPRRWPELHDLNRDRIADPDLIFPGQRLRVPWR